MSENEEILDAPENPGTGKEDKLSTALTVISFCFPIVGAIIYFTSKDDRPQRAKTACNAALWGFALGVVMRIISMAAGVE